MSKTSVKDFSSTNNIRKVFRSYFPVQAFASGLPSINTLFSSFIIGNFFGTTGLAAIGFAGPMILLLTAVASTISMGAQLLCGKFIGKGDKAGAKGLYSTTLILCILCGLLLSIITFSGTQFIARLLGASAETFEMTMAYLRGQAVGMIFTVLSTSLIPFVQLDQAKKVSTAAIAAMVITNIGFNFLNALVLHWGLFGVGLATSVGYAASSLICFVYLLINSKVFRFSFRSISLEDVKQVFVLGAPTCVSNVCGVFRDRVYNAVLYSFGGNMAVSAATLAMNISNAIGGSTIQGGYSGTTNLISSVLIGERDVDSLRKLPKTLITSIYPIYIAGYILLFIFAKPIVLFFGADPAAIDLFVMALRLYCLWFFSNPFKVPSLSIYWSLGKVKLVSFFYFMNDFLTPIFCYTVLSKFFGIGVVYGATIINEVVNVICYIIYFRIMMKRMPHSLFKITYIPRTISVAKENTLALSIQTTEEATNASSQVIDFCKSKGFSSKMSYYTGLAIEEMVVDTLKNRVKEETKRDPVTVDVRVYYEDGGISVLLRDNCEEFDPLEWMELHAPEDPMRSLGIKMVTAKASDMSHHNSLGLNVLTFRMEPESTNTAA